MTTGARGLTFDDIAPEHHQFAASSARKRTRTRGENATPPPQAPYGDIFAVTCIKTMAVFVVIAFYYLTGIY